ncbi:aromatic ring-hydroxylating dioxygenase subunit alpha [Pseudomonadales bacterium]|nr:aromatic ring-hydroxylating dioxygenase subunit alpha [Pseudomonadales bacterium]
MSRTAMGAHTLPGEYFTSREVYDQETDQIFLKSWICAGRASTIPNPGDFFLHEMDGESFIIIRAESGQINCLYNVCRHRGTRITQESCGHIKSRLHCPYHAWGYDTDGNLKSAPNMMGTDGFCEQDHSLKNASCVTWQGFILINKQKKVSSFQTDFDDILNRFDDWELDLLLSVHEISYEVKANWKVIFQNYSECYHCSLVHPQLRPITSVANASNDFEHGHFLGGPMILADDYKSVTTSGEWCGLPLKKLSTEDLRRVYFYTMCPSLFISPHPDYVLTHRIERVDVDTTRIVCNWLFPPAVLQRDSFDASEAIEFWDLTNRQDWEICELTQKGVRSRAYQPGPYSELESMLAAFDRHYLSLMATG